MKKIDFVIVNGENADETGVGLTKEILTKPKETYTKSLVSSVPPTNRKISRFVIIEKENKKNKENNLKILNRWTKKSIVKQDLIQIKTNPPPVNIFYIYFTVFYTSLIKVKSLISLFYNYPIFFVNHHIVL